MSVNVGQPITFYVSVASPQQFDIRIYRVGWYFGNGGRLHYTTTGLQGRTQILAEADRTTGLIDYNWILDGPVSDYSWTPPEVTVSGFFLARLTTQDGKQSYIPFVVRNDSQVSDFLFQNAVTTYQAYNGYPGNAFNGDWRSGSDEY